MINVIINVHDGGSETEVCDLESINLTREEAIVKIEQAIKENTTLTLRDSDGDYFVIGSEILKKSLCMVTEEQD